MSKNNRNKDTRILRSRKQKIKRRLRRKQWEEQEQPMLRGSNIHYEMGERNGAINCGGIGVFHQMVKKIGLIDEIDARGCLIKRAEELTAEVAELANGRCDQEKGEFRRFLHTLVLLPCQIIRTGRKIVYRLLGYNDWLKDFFAAWKRIKLLRTISIVEWSKPV